jgi:hypothetical protein
MAIEYWLELDCPVKEQLGLGTFKNTLKKRLIAQGLLERNMRSGMSKEAALKDVWKLGVKTPDGKKKVREFRIGAVLEETNILDIMVDRCTDCPAAMGMGYGCYNVINYPISARAECWLAEKTKLAGERKDTANMPIRVIFDRKLTGEAFTRMRRELDPRPFENEAALEIKFDKGPFKRRTMTTDQVLDVLFLTRELSGTFLENLSFFCGGLEVTEKEPRQGTFQDASEVLNSNGNRKWFVFNLPEDEGDDLSTRQLKRFFWAVFRALEMDRSVTVDV